MAWNKAELGAQTPFRLRALGVLRGETVYANLLRGSSRSQSQKGRTVDLHCDCTVLADIVDVSDGIADKVH